MNTTCRLIGVMAVLIAQPVAAAITPQQVNQAQWTRPPAKSKQLDPVVLRAQVLLDRNSISPGVIDGTYGSNFKKALRVFQSTHGLPTTGVLDQATWQALLSTSPGEALVAYQIQATDVKGPFIRRVPGDVRRMAHLPRMAYTSPHEALGERFHTDQKVLAKLNPGADFKKPGTTLYVPNVGSRAPTEPVKSVVVDKRVRAVKAYGKDGRLIGYYPATIGSGEFPSPTGSYKVVGIQKKPAFTLSGKLKYSDLKPNEKIHVPPGPNNPVGVVWIGLNKYGFGIHGSPQPKQIGATVSHGCVRLTNWDALDLAGKVEKGTPVRFAG
jgi:lipoprotein-anchoring transpeptidase ErfK/SrfK